MNINDTIRKLRREVSHYQFVRYFFLLNVLCLLYTLTLWVSYTSKDYYNYDNSILGSELTGVIAYLPFNYQIA